MNLARYLSELENALFWGDLTIQFREGRPVLLRKMEQVKIDEKQEAPSRNNHRDFHAPSGVGHGNGIDAPGN